MLCPVNHELQPFRFVSLAADDHRRLGALVGQQASQASRRFQNESELAWIEKFRAASAQQCQPSHWRLKMAEVVSMLMIGLATAAYVLDFGLIK
jgi:hypothetical protein